MKQLSGITTTANDIVNHNIRAISDVQVLDSNLKPSYIVKAGQNIGTVYSWVIRATDGRLAWMFYKDQTAFRNFQPSYVINDPSKMTVPDYPQIVKDLEDKRKQEQINSKGLVQYYLDQYLPYIVGGVVIAFVAPSILNRQKVSGMKNNDLIKLGGAALLLWFLYAKKRKAGPLILDLDEGEFVNRPNTTTTVEAVQISKPESNQQSGGGGSIAYVGPFSVEYNQQQSINGRRDIGRVKLI